MWAIQVASACRTCSSPCASLSLFFSPSSIPPFLSSTSFFTSFPPSLMLLPLFCHLLPGLLPLVTNSSFWPLNRRKLYNNLDLAHICVCVCEGEFVYFLLLILDLDLHHTRVSSSGSFVCDVPVRHMTKSPSTNFSLPVPQPLPPLSLFLFLFLPQS